MSDRSRRRGLVRRTGGWRGGFLFLQALLIISLEIGCTRPDDAGNVGAGTATPAIATPVLGIDRSPRVAHIVNPTTGFPRTVQDVSGLVTIPIKPMRIHTLSVGYDEITFRLVDPARIIAVGRATANPDFSNVADLARAIPNQVGREAESIAALKPDLVVASPFASADLLAQLRTAGVPLVVADLVSSVDAQAENIRFLAYLYGEEERGEVLVKEVRQQLAALARFVDLQPATSRPRVLLLEGTVAAGGGTNEDGVLRLAGARNAAAEAGLVGNRELSLEAIPTMDPDWIVLADSNLEQPSLGQQLVENPALHEVRAIRSAHVIRFRQSLVSTLSQWNVVGATQLAHQFYPG